MDSKAFSHGFNDAWDRLNEAQQASNEDAAREGARPTRIDDAGWRGDWTEALINNATDDDLMRLGLNTKAALADYQRGAIAAVEHFFSDDD